MDKKVKYYRAINERYDLLLRLIGGIHTREFVQEFLVEVEAILTVAIYDHVAIKDFEKLRAYATHMEKKARQIPR